MEVSRGGFFNKIIRGRLIAYPWEYQLFDRDCVTDLGQAENLLGVRS